MLLENDIEDEILEEEFAEVIVESDEVFVGAFVGNIQMLATNYTRRFFQSREMYCGGSVPERFVLNDNAISMVMNTRLEEGVQQAYNIIEQDGRYSSEAVDSLVPEDVKLVISVIRYCSKLGIPQGFIPGLLLLYLEFCEGMSCKLI